MAAKQKKKGAKNVEPKTDANIDPNDMNKLDTRFDNITDENFKVAWKYMEQLEERMQHVPEGSGEYITVENEHEQLDKVLLKKENARYRDKQNQVNNEAKKAFHDWQRDNDLRESRTPRGCVI